MVGLHLHSGDHTCTLQLFCNEYPKNYTYTCTLSCYWNELHQECNRKWLDYTYTLEITLTLFNCFLIDAPKIALTLTLLNILTCKSIY